MHVTGPTTARHTKKYEVIDKIKFCFVDKYKIFILVVVLG